MRRILALMVTAFCLALVTPPANAQKGDRAAAQRFFRAGERAFDAGQYVAAAQAFEEAYKTLPLPAIAFSAAQSYRLQFFIDKDRTRLKRSIELYRLYILEVPSGGRRQDAVTGLSELEPTLERLEAEQAQQGKGPIESRPVAKAETRFMISSQVPGAMVAIDAGEPAAMPVVAQVEPGPHKVVYSAEGYFPVETSVVAIESQLLPVEATLKPKPALVKLQTEGGASVSVDGRAAGKYPLRTPLELTEGKHLISVIRNGRYAWSREVDVKRGQELGLKADLRATKQRRASYWVLGSSAAVLVASGVFAGLAWKSDGNADDILARAETETLLPTDLDNYDRHRAARDDRLGTTYILAGVGGGLAMTGLLLYLLDTPTTEVAPASTTAPSVEPTAVSVVPILGDGVSGLGLTRSF